MISEDISQARDGGEAKLRFQIDGSGYRNEAVRLKSYFLRLI